jgi:hypothetical protein
MRSVRELQYVDIRLIFHSCQKCASLRGYVATFLATASVQAIIFLYFCISAKFNLSF